MPNEKKKQSIADARWYIWTTILMCRISRFEGCPVDADITREINIDLMRARFNDDTDLQIDRTLAQFVMGMLCRLASRVS